MSEYIERQKAIEALTNNALIGETESGYTWFYTDEVYSILKTTPSADVVQVVRGKWIHDGHHRRCDRCGTYFCNTDREGDTIPDNFCPNCGAKMDTRIPVTPYIEPDTEKVKEEAYRQGYDTGYGTKVNEFYEQGLADAWEAARKIAISEESGGLTCREMQRIFCTDETDEIFDMSASEAIEKIRQYEQEQEEQESITAEKVMRQYLDTFCKGRNCGGCPLHTPDFTCGRGRHFLTYDHPVSDEEVRRAYAAVLAKMKENS